MKEGGQVEQNGKKYLKNPMYKLVKDPKKADAAAWGFFKPTQDLPSLFYYKFPKIGRDEIRIAVEWTGLC